MLESAVRHLFPPREDVRVGDVYLDRSAAGLAPSTDGGNTLPIDLWISSLEMRLAGAPPRPVTFPVFSTMSVSGCDLTGLVPVEALALAFGANWKGRHQVDVKLESVESHGLPAVDVLVAALGPGGKLGVPLTTDLLTWLHGGGVRWSGTPSSLADGERDRLAAEPVLHLDLICEVFCTREIELGISTALARGADAAPASADAASVLAQELNAKLEKVGVETPLGGSFRFLGASALGVSLRRTFTHPIAVGYRSVPLRVEPISGTLVERP